MLPRPPPPKTKIAARPPPKPEWTGPCPTVGPSKLFVDAAVAWHAERDPKPANL